MPSLTREHVLIHNALATEEHKVAGENAWPESHQVTRHQLGRGQRHELAVSECLNLTLVMRNAREAAPVAIRLDRRGDDREPRDDKDADRV